MATTAFEVVDHLTVDPLIGLQDMTNTATRVRSPLVVADNHSYLAALLRLLGDLSPVVSLMNPFDLVLTPFRLILDNAILDTTNLWITTTSADKQSRAVNGKRRHSLKDATHSSCFMLSTIVYVEELQLLPSSISII
ncbi:hypothetical protein SNK03_005984 [Fusarium graminearum]|nr:unnamed protein product [Fusarium graminearum]